MNSKYLGRNSLIYLLKRMANEKKDLIAIYWPILVDDKHFLFVTKQLQFSLIVNIIVQLHNIQDDQ